MTEKLDITKSYIELKETIEKGDHNQILTMCNKILNEYNKMQEELFQKSKWEINPKKYIAENKKLYKQIEWLENCIKNYEQKIYDNYSMEDIVDNIESLVYHNFDGLTNEEIIEEIKEEIKKIHDYDVAEISSYEIVNANNNFLKWIDDSTK